MHTFSLQVKYHYCSVSSECQQYACVMSVLSAFELRHKEQHGDKWPLHSTAAVA